MGNRGVRFEGEYASSNLRHDPQTSGRPHLLVPVWSRGELTCILGGPEGLGAAGGFSPQRGRPRRRGRARPAVRRVSQRASGCPAKRRSSW